jgi:hypothetical protein
MQNGAKISIPEDRSFETEGEAIESRDMVMRSLVEPFIDSGMRQWSPNRSMTLATHSGTYIESWNVQKSWSDHLSPPKLFFDPKRSAGECQV